MSHMICIVQIQPRKHVLDHAHYMSYIDHTNQEYTWYLPCLADLYHAVGIGDISEV